MLDLQTAVEGSPVLCFGRGGRKVCGERGSFRPIFQTPPPGVAPVMGAPHGPTEGGLGGQGTPTSLQMIATRR